MRKSVVPVAFWCCLFTSSAFATPVSFDFTKDPFGNAEGQPSFPATVDGLTILIEALGGNAALDAGEYGVDGLGIQSDSYEPDEIEGNEALRITFSQPVFITGLFFADLFNEPNSVSGNNYLETGWYQLGNDNPIAFQADSSQVPGQSNGVLALFNIPSVAIDVITFTAPGKLDNGESHEFAVSGVNVDVVATPEPGTLALLGSGLAGLGALRRRKQLSGNPA